MNGELEALQVAVTGLQEKLDLRLEN